MKITIVTSVLNAFEELLVTKKSIESQSYRNLQWIIIDGQSTDGTLDLLKEIYVDNLITISEPDSGIYNAWNKALNLVEGEWVIFLGAGDRFFSNNTLLECSFFLHDLHSKSTVVYGNLCFIDGCGNELGVSKKPWNLLRNQWENSRPALPVFPECFLHASLFINQKFNEDLKYAADSFFLLSIIRDFPPSYIDINVSCMSIGGVSQNPDYLHKIKKEIDYINDFFQIVVPIRVKFWFFIKSFLKKIMYKILGNRSYFSVMGFMYKLLLSKESRH